eukprot:scaffold45494_cov17-Tisochrysis_lutea.AAC.1
MRVEGSGCKAMHPYIGRSSQQQGAQRAGGQERLWQGSGCRNDKVSAEDAMQPPAPQATRACTSLHPATSYVQFTGVKEQQGRHCGRVRVSASATAFASSVLAGNSKPAHFVTLLAESKARQAKTRQGSKA